jgi:DNA-nicking Smr family endonuclease
MGRQLNPEEKALWGRVMATVQPLKPTSPALAPPEPLHPALAPGPRIVSDLPRKAGPRVKRGVPEHKLVGPSASTLDASWDRRIHKGVIVPDVSVDLHETTLSGAYARLDRALDQAIHQKLRVVLLVTGKARGHDRASGRGRGAIAAVVRDWLAASRHCAHISAVRQAHPRHGGEGALYIILKR